MTRSSGMARIVTIVGALMISASATPALACRWPVNTPLPNYPVADLDAVRASDSPVIFSGIVESSDASGVAVRNQDTFRGDAPSTFVFEDGMTLRCFYPDTERRFSDFPEGSAVLVFGGHDMAGGFALDEVVLKDGPRGQHLFSRISNLYRPQAQ